MAGTSGPLKNDEQQQQQQHVDAADLTLLNLHNRLQQLQDSGNSSWCSASDTSHLADLRQTAATLRRHHAQHATPDACCACPVLSAAAAGCAELLAQLLLQPPEQLFSGLSGVPSEPPTGLELAGEHFHATAAAQLQLLLQLLQLTGALLELPPVEEQQQQQAAGSEEDSKRARNRPRHFVGVVEIVELSDEEESAVNGAGSDPQQELRGRVRALLPLVLRTAALYAADSSHAAATALAAAADAAGGGGSAGSGGGSVEAAAVCLAAGVVQQGLVLHSPWTDASCNQQCRPLLRHLSEHVKVAASSSSGGGRGGRVGAGRAPVALPNSSVADDAGARAQEAEQQQQQQQAFWRLAVPSMLGGLRDTLLAQHRHKRLQDRGDMVPYTGPSTYQRCLAARQLAWALQQLQPASLDEGLLGLLLPLLLATTDDPSPAVQQYGHAGLGWLGLHCQPAVLQWQGPLLASELTRLVVGCEEACWATAMPAATSLALALKGRDPRSPTYHTLLLELLTSAERGARQPQQRLVFAACVARLAPRLGLYCARHYAALLPLLTEWAHAHDERSAAASMSLLALLARCGWPRMAAHAAVLRQHAEAVLVQEAGEARGGGGGGRGSSSAHDASQQPPPQQQHGEDGGPDNRSEAAGGAAAAAGSGASSRAQAAQQLLETLQCVADSWDAVARSAGTAQ